MRSAVAAAVPDLSMCLAVGVVVPVKAVVEYIYKGRAVVAKLQDCIEVYTILGNLGVPRSSSVRIP